MDMLSPEGPLSIQTEYTLSFFAKVSVKDFIPGFAQASPMP